MSEKILMMLLKIIDCIIAHQINKRSQMEGFQIIYKLNTVDFISQCLIITHPNKTKYKHFDD